MENEIDKSGIKDLAARQRWNSNKGQFKDPEVLAKAIAIRKANAAERYKDLGKLMMWEFSRPQKGGSTIKKMVYAIGVASTSLSERVASGELMGEDLEKTLRIIDGMSKMVERLQKMNEIRKPANILIQNNIGSSKTGGVVGSIVDVEPTKVTNLADMTK